MTIREIKKGDYFKIVNSKGVVSYSVYVRGEYDRSTKKYLAYKFYDVCACKEFKPTQQITTEFEF